MEHGDVVWDVFRAVFEVGAANRSTKEGSEIDAFDLGPMLRPGEDWLS
jgi:hypothetical protein